MLEIEFIKQKRTIKAEEGETIREAAIKNKLSIYSHIFKILNCRGRGLCQSCVMEVISGDIAPRNDIENKQLAGKLDKNPKLRLGCQVKVSGNLIVKTHI